MDKWICSCGKENTSKFCTSCGKARPMEQVIPNTAENTWICSCGKKNTSKFCTGCGKQRPAQQTSEGLCNTWICSCGKENTTKFCVACGSDRATVNQAAVPNDDMSVNLESTPEVNLADAGIYSTDNVQDLQLVNGIPIDIDSNMPLEALQNNYTADCFFPINNSFTIDPSPFIGNIISPRDTIVLSDASGMPSMTLNDGAIFDGGSSQICSYEYNHGMDSTIFFDSNHNPVYSVNSNGVYFDSSGQQIGCARDAGAITTVFDKNEQPIYQIDKATNSIFDKYGRPIGTIRQG